MREKGYRLPRYNVTVKHFLWFLFCCLPAALLAQTATFPGAVVTDPQMMIAGNNLNTTLVSNISSTDTSITVASSAGFQRNMLISFSDSHEIAVICDVNGNTLSIGYGGPCPSLAGRGFDGTTASGHIAKAQVAGFYVAWHRNVDRVEIEAIETALGAGLSNVGTVKQVSVACGIAASPGTITTTGTISLTDLTAPHNGTYAIVTGDCGKTITSNTAAAWSIPQAGTAGFLAGWMVTVNNVGSGAITVTTPTSIFYGGPPANISGSVLTIPANTGALFFSDGTNYQVYVGGSSSGGGGSGTLTNVATACGISGGPITTTGTLSLSSLTGAHNGAYAVVSGDCGRILTSNTTAAWTIAQASTGGFITGWAASINNIGAGTITLTATTSTFYGGPSANISGSVLTVQPNSSVVIASDGTNYQVLPGGGGGGSPGAITSVNVAPSGSCGSNVGQLVGPGGLIYACTNGTWQQIGQGLNIRSFGGAKADGSDDFAAIQATVAAVAALPNGGTVYCPSGTYSISQSITWTAANVYWASDGGCTLAVRATFTGAAGMIVGASSASPAPLLYGGISNTTVDLSANSTPTLRGIQLIQTWFLVLNNVHIKNPNGLPTPIQTALELSAGGQDAHPAVIIFGANNDIYNLEVGGSFVYAIRQVTGCTGACPNAGVNGTNYFGGSIFGDSPHPAGTFGLHIDDNSGDSTRVYGLRIEDYDTCVYVGSANNGPIDPRLEGCTTATYASPPTVNFTIPNLAYINAAFASPVTATQAGTYYNNTSGAVTYNLPVLTGATIGMQWCFQQYFSNTGAITLQLPASTFLKVNGGSGATAGTFISTGTAGDSVCIVALNPSVYSLTTIVGVWSGTAGTASGAPATFDSFASPVAATLQGTYDNRTGGSVTYNLPVLTGNTLGQRWCFGQYFFNTGAITLQLPASTFLSVNGVAGNPAGTFTSVGTSADMVCVVAINPLVYATYGIVGVWSGTAGTGSGAPGLFDSFASPVAATLQGTYDNRTGGAVTWNLPLVTTSTVGQRWCFIQYPPNAGALTLQFPTGTFLSVGGVFGSAAGAFTSSGTTADSVCVTALNALAYAADIKGGVWSGTAGSGGAFAACGGTYSFTSQTTFTVTGATHGCGAKVLWNVYDTTDATVDKEIQPNTLTVNKTTFDVIVTFALSQTGRIVIK